MANIKTDRAGDLLHEGHQDSVAGFDLRDGRLAPKGEPTSFERRLCRSGTVAGEKDTNLLDDDFLPFPTRGISPRLW
jgi:hypothetical protein